MWNASLLVQWSPGTLIRGKLTAIACSHAPPTQTRQDCLILSVLAVHVNKLLAANGVQCAILLKYVIDFRDYVDVRQWYYQTLAFVTYVSTVLSLICAVEASVSKLSSAPFICAMLYVLYVLILLTLDLFKSNFGGKVSSGYKVWVTHGLVFSAWFYGVLLNYICFSFSFLLLLFTFLCRAID